MTIQIQVSPQYDSSSHHHLTLYALFSCGASLYQCVVVWLAPPGEYLPHSLRRRKQLHPFSLLTLQFMLSDMDLAIWWGIAELYVLSSLLLMVSELFYYSVLKNMALKKNTNVQNTLKPTSMYIIQLTKISCIGVKLYQSFVSVGYLLVNLLVNMSLKAT